MSWGICYHDQPCGCFSSKNVKAVRAVLQEKNILPADAVVIVSSLLRPSSGLRTLGAAVIDPEGEQDYWLTLTPTLLGHQGRGTFKVASAGVQSVVSIDLYSPTPTFIDEGSWSFLGRFLKTFVSASGYSINFNLDASDDIEVCETAKRLGEALGNAWKEAARPFPPNATWVIKEELAIGSHLAALTLGFLPHSSPAATLRALGVSRSQMLLGSGKWSDMESFFECFSRESGLTLDFELAPEWKDAPSAVDALMAALGRTLRALTQALRQAALATPTGTGPAA